MNSLLKIISIINGNQLKTCFRLSRPYLVFPLHELVDHLGSRLSAHHPPGTIFELEKILVKVFDDPKSPVDYWDQAATSRMVEGVAL